MNAAVLMKPGEFQLKRVPVPELGPGQVLIQLEGCGVCASNLPVWEGRPWFQYPLAPGELGHEGWGRVVALGPNSHGRDDQGADGAGARSLREGDRVATLSQRAYAEYTVCPMQDVVRLPETVRGPFPGEPLGCAFNVFQRSDICRDHRVAIIGIGFLGALLTKLAADTGAQVIAISRRKYALDVARMMGATDVIPMESHHGIVERVRALTSGELCDRVIEAVGLQWPLDLGGELTCERGRLVVAGYHQDSPRQVNMQLWNWRGLDIINAHERQVDVYREGIRTAAAAVAGGALQPSPLYTHRFPLEGLGQALDMTRDRPDGFLKALIMMENRAEPSRKRGAG